MPEPTEPGLPTLLYRHVANNPPLDDDFKPQGQLGMISKSKMTIAQARRWNAACSMYDDPDHLLPRISRDGGYISVLDVSKLGPTALERTPSKPEHFDVYADPETLRASVVHTYDPMEGQ